MALPGTVLRSQERSRTHVFLSYATEDASFVDWLALKLAAAGYDVWYDRLTLLGGESYPRDIDTAIREKVFIVVAVVSHHSLTKPNPLKERTQAINIGRERGIDFLIPLLLEQLPTSALGWQLSDLTYVPFHSDWGTGLARLLKRLESLQAPCDQHGGRGRVKEWLAQSEAVLNVPEPIGSNLLPLVEAPARMQLYALPRRESLALAAQRWAFARQDEKTVWAFGPPEEGLGITATPRGRPLLWETGHTHEGRPLPAIASELIRRCIEVDSLSRGLRSVPSHQQVYFPSRLLEGDRLQFTSYDGELRHVSVVGRRTKRKVDGTRAVTNYFLAFGVRPSLRHFGPPVVRLDLGAHFTDSTGKDLPPGQIGRKQRSLKRSWWNHQLYSRVLACSSWITRGQTERTILRTDSGSLIVGRTPLEYTSPVSIDERALTDADPPKDQLESEDEGDDDDIEEPDEVST